MNKSLLKNIIFLLCCSISGAVYADDAAQTNLRLNPEIEAVINPDIDYSEYKFLNIKANTIEMPDSMRHALATKFEAACRGEGLFTVLYLGDSHIQADFGGDVLRRRLQAVGGNAGRGIVIPFRLAGTNQPVDYSIESADVVAGARLLKMPWPVDMTFTGIGVQFADSVYNISVSARSPFKDMRFYYANGVTDDVLLDYSTDSVDLTMENRGVLGGIDLRADSVGVLVHSIGNNGAEYGSYYALDNFGKDLSALGADLIIVALGTNEAFSSASEDDMSYNIFELMSDMRAANPDAAFVMVTPAECYKKIWRRGKKGRRSARQVVNNKVSVVRSLIMDYAKEEGIPVYDHYAVASGKGAASGMRAAGVLGKDGVHFTANGYRLWGNLLSDAILAILLPEGEN